MKKLNQRHALFASTMLCGAALLGATQANAQAAAAAAAPADTGSAVTEVVVTGSRIPHANLESASPLTIVTSGEVKAEGVVNIETLLNNLPSIVAGQNSTVSNGSSGTATVDLRGLGVSRTLVLIDGRRLQAGDPVVPVADLNFIPTPLVERVEILTGGASSTYGADAVAGVVNFIMKKDFEGIQVDGQYGFDQSGNDSDEAGNYLAKFGLKRPGNVVESNNTQVSIVMGVNSPDNKGNVTAYAEYTNLQPILEATRDFSDCSLTDVTNAKGVGNAAHGCVGSSNNAHGRINLTGQGKAPLTNFNAPAGSFVPYSGAAAFNFGPFNFFQRTDNRYNLGAFGHYQVNEHADVYLDAMFMDDDTTAQIAPSGFFQGPTYYIPCNNAFLSANQATQIGCGSAFEGGNASAPAGTPVGSIATTIGFRFAGHNRDTDIRHDEYRIVLGSKGDIADGWTYDAYLQYGESVFQSKIIGDVSDVKLQNALNTTSTTTCVVGGKCVPVNIFADNAISQGAVNYLLTPGLIEGSTTEQVAELDVNGDLGQYGLKSPWAKEAIKINLGIDDRRENLVETVDNEEASGDLSGSGGATPPASGSFNVYEVYTELSVPLISDMDFVKSLDFDTGYRYSHYDDVGQTETYMFKLEYAPVADVKFRASFNHAVRAPNVDELFAPTTVGLFSGNDPCATTKVGVAPADSLVQCMRSGVTAAQYGTITPCPASQCSQELGGNPNLKPEDSDTTSFGVVFTPTFIKGFSATVDYYNIQVNGIIQGISPNISLNNCLNGNLTFCPLVHRDAAGDLLGPNGFVVATEQNTGYLHTTGYDFEVDYRIKLADMYLPDWGSLAFNFVGTYTEKFANQPVTGGGHYDCAGLYGPVCGNPDPHWRHKLRVTWSTPWNFDISGQWRYLGGVKLDTNEGNPLLANGYHDVVDKDIPDYSYFDLTGNWRVKDGLTFRAGVNNVFDKDPPIISTVADQVGVGNGNTYPGVYDSLGRQFFIGLTAKF